MMFVEYDVCRECKNPYVINLCLHCGACGRIFEDGICTNIGRYPSVGEQYEENEEMKDE